MTLANPAIIDATAYYDGNTHVMVLISNNGGYGYIKEFPAEKFYRDSKLCTIGEGTTEIQKLVISRNILK